MPLAERTGRRPHRRLVPPAARENVAVWLKHLENRSLHSRDHNDPMAPYDFTWMWRELNVEHLRN